MQTPQPPPTPSDLDLGAALAELDASNRKAAAVVRAYLDRQQQETPLNRLLAVAVDPVWRAAVEAIAEYNEIKQRDIEAAVQAAAATRDLARVYTDRTALWRDMVLPKVMPAVGILLVVFVAWIAMLLGVEDAMRGALAVPTP